ncbi:uncharacterized protein LOC122259282 [Penaeus japonicus]|uniref:uncharacterized protein LOC122259282 n=1 Tax=Penaeus japonicus TaxID=27405 RepID=UPI001C70B605|nr:uncharacterized protein LOC122259282 [Penaeus japonicus]
MYTRCRNGNRCYVKSTKERNFLGQLYKSQRYSELFDNDLDWIGLWPRTGSYKRFTNLDDVTSMVTLDESVRPPEEPDLPPQPLRPAPAPPPSRMPGGWTDSGEGSPSPASSSIGLGAGVETPPEPSRPAPVLDRRDSNRSLSGRIQRRDSSKELLVSSQQSSPKRSSTNPFRASWVPPDEASEGAYVEEASHDVFSASSRRAPSGTGRGAVSSGAERVNEEMQRAPASNALPEKPDAKAAVPTMASVTQGSDTVVDWFGGGAGDRAGGINVTSSGGTGWFTGTNNQGISSGGVSSVVSTGSGSSWLSGLTGINSGVGVTSSGGVSGVGGVISNSVGDVAGNRETSGGVVAQAGNVHTSTVYDNSLNYKPLQPDSLLNRINETKDTSIFGNQNYYTTTDYTKPESVAGTGVSATTTLYNNQISTTTNAETVSSAGAVPGLLLPSRDPVLPSDFGGATDVPATPPNTATFDPSSPSPYITSRLAEVEARIGLLGARQQEEEQSTPLGSAQVEGGRRTEGGKNPFLVLGSGEADRKGLSAVEEEVSLLHDAVDTSRTQPLVQPHSELGSETSKSVLGGERSPRGETKEEEKKETGEMEKEKKKEEEEEETEEDASTRRVREYIASLSARLRQIPDDSSIGQDSLSQMRTPPPSAAFPITPPNSAARLSGETPPSSAGLYTPFGSRPPSSSTPPSSATGLRNLYSSRRASADASPLSPVVFTLSTSRRLSLDTPPSSADLVTATPPNSASSQAVFGETPPSSAGYSSTPPNSAGLAGAFEGGVSAGMLKRAMSCDSVSSDTSVTLGELEDTCGQVTGHLAIQLIYDRIKV